MFWSIAFSLGMMLASVLALFDARCGISIHRSIRQVAQSELRERPWEEVLHNDVIEYCNRQIAWNHDLVWVAKFGWCINLGVIVYLLGNALLKFLTAQGVI